MFQKYILKFKTYISLMVNFLLVCVNVNTHVPGYMCRVHRTTSDIDLCFFLCLRLGLFVVHSCACHGSWLAKFWEFMPLPPICQRSTEITDVPLPLDLCGFSYLNSGPHTSEKCFLSLSHLSSSVCV